MSIFNIQFNFKDKSEDHVPFVWAPRLLRQTHPHFSLCRTHRRRILILEMMIWVGYYDFLKVFLRPCSQIPLRPLRTERGTQERKS